MPIIPLSREYFLSCPTCESGWQIDSKDNVKALRKLGKVSARYQKQKINIDQFAQHIDTFYENHDLE